MSADILQSPGGTEYRRTIVKAHAAAQTENPAVTASQPPQEDPARARRMEFLQWLQLFGILIAVVTLVYAVGKRDQVLDDLKTIVTKLVEYNIHTQSELSALRAEVENLKFHKP